VDWDYVDLFNGFYVMTFFLNYPFLAMYSPFSPLPAYFASALSRYLWGITGTLEFVQESYLLPLSLFSFCDYRYSLAFISTCYGLDKLHSYCKL